MNSARDRWLLVGICIGCGTAAACDLRVSGAWIRTPVPGVSTLAGYALLQNTGHNALTITALSASQFAHVQMHESAQHDGVMQMRPLSQLTVAANASVQFQPDGKHFMLTGPTSPLKDGDLVSIRFTDSTGCSVSASFRVGTPAAANAVPAMPGMKMN